MVTKDFYPPYKLFPQAGESFVTKVGSVNDLGCGGHFYFPLFLLIGWVFSSGKHLEPANKRKRKGKRNVAPSGPMSGTSRFPKIPVAFKAGFVTKSQES